MNHNEVRGIAKSIARWVWKRDSYCYQEFIDRQTRKSKLGASKGGAIRSMQYQDKREKAQQLKIQGLSNSQIAEQLEVHRNTITSWLK
jgi:DNA-binding NarL/FixJ family response regulator